MEVLIIEKYLFMMTEKHTKLFVLLEQDISGYSVKPIMILMVQSMEQYMLGWILKNPKFQRD